jgi:hypothetical protein
LRKTTQIYSSQNQKSVLQNPRFRKCVKRSKILKYNLAVFGETAKGKVSKMSTVFEPVVSGGVVAVNGKSNGNGNNHDRAEIANSNRLGLNGQKVVGKRYSLKDLNGDPIENLDGHRAARRSVTSRKPRAKSGNARLFLQFDAGDYAQPRIRPEYAVSR